MVGLDNPLHIAFLLVILLLVFGAKRLPEMGHSLGAGLRGFKDSLSGETRATELNPVAMHMTADEQVANESDSEKAEHSHAAPVA